ncbi:MAG: hypothetical protein WC841_05470 [Candidatus Shapirobacteria bacterium]|jgi:hypothetical protein
MALNLNFGASGRILNLPLSPPLKKGGALLVVAIEWSEWGDFIFLTVRIATPDVKSGSQ